MPENRLAGETSPYLLQHAHNPVDWYPWGPEALARAKAEDRPIFLSIGYAACHWCHVMERESFEDESTAAQLNAGFVAIKVDREERPDLDAVYMDAVQSLTGGGGWPMSVFLTPDGRPFYGGTYFPDAPRHGMPSFRQVLSSIEGVWREDRPRVEATADSLTGALRAQADGATPAERVGPAKGGLVGPDGRTLLASAVPPTIDPAMLDTTTAGLAQSFDRVHGGWGGAPKFPAPMTIEHLLRRFVRAGDTRALAMVRTTLDAMTAGGIHDQLGGGFARYSTDAEWLAPHFEKMLYDNAQLARAYLHAWQVTGEPRYRAVVESTLDYLVGEMAVPDSGFAASQDADTNGEEGATYVWSAGEVATVLGEEAPLFAAAYDVTTRGNWEGHTILRRVREDADLAKSFDTTEADVGDRLAAARERLLAVRRVRPQPARDGKVIAAWNGLALAAFAEAAAALGRDDYQAVAERAAAALLDALIGPDGRLHRSWKDGRSTNSGVLEDHADLAEGLLALYMATFNERWFSAARDLAEIILARFSDPTGGWFDTADDHETLVARPKGVSDNALPSGGAMSATVLLRLAALTGEGRFRMAAEAGIAAVAPLAARYPNGFAQWLVAADLAAYPIDEVAIVGDPTDANTAALIGVVRKGFRPGTVVALADARGAPTSTVPLLRDRPQVEGGATAYVCRGFACLRPTTDADGLSAQLAGGQLERPPQIGSTIRPSP
ncbi:MAG: thioredoxin domain-containing protein [Candidatus Limnocylindrales bacterium]